MRRLLSIAVLGFGLIGLSACNSAASTNASAHTLSSGNPIVWSSGNPIVWSSGNPIVW